MTGQTITEVRFGGRVWQTGETVPFRIRHASKVGWFLGATEVAEILVLPAKVELLPFLEGFVSRATNWLWCVAPFPFDADPNDPLFAGYNITGVPIDECLVCGTCEGTGKYVGFLVVEDCDDCEGLGISPPPHVPFTQIFRRGG